MELPTREVVVSARSVVAEGVVLLTLAATDGGQLPAWTPGAHVDLLLAPGLERQYSLCGDPAETGRWQVAVLREPAGRGGSAHVHERVAVGERLQVRGPRNNFAFTAEGEVAFVAGGIGITALLPMIGAAEGAGAPWRLLYAGRSRRTMAFVADLVERFPDRVEVYAADEGRRLDVAADLGAGEVVYACGPRRLLDALEERCPAGTLHVERFEAKEFGEPVWDGDFEVELAMTGVTITVPPGRSILEVAEEAGALVVSSCREGTCGTCETAVLEGEVEHRDSVLSPEEQGYSDVMMVCVSRAACPRLVLEL